jgi:hypothetical protein
VQRSFWLTRRTRLRQHHGQLVFVAFLILRFHHAPSAAGHCKPSLPIQILYKPASFPIFLLASTCIGPQNVLYVRMCFVASYARRFPPPLLALIWFSWGYPDEPGPWRFQSGDHGAASPSFRR